VTWPFHYEPRKAAYPTIHYGCAPMQEGLAFRSKGSIGVVLVALGLNQHIEKFALRVDCAPQICHPAIDLQIDFVKVPSRVRLRAVLAQLRCNHRSEMIHPAAHGFVGDRDPALGWQIIDVTKAEGEPLTLETTQGSRTEALARPLNRDSLLASISAHILVIRDGLANE
jgi:hypothetical protein